MLKKKNSGTASRHCCLVGREGAPYADVLGSNRINLNLFRHVLTYMLPWKMYEMSNFNSGLHSLSMLIQNIENTKKLIYI